MPAFSITAAHLAISLFMRSVIASGVLPRISMPGLLTFSWILGLGKTSLMARVRTWTTVLGVAAGTEIPFQLTTSKSLIPLSWMVGTAGRYAVRFWPVEATAMTLLSAICPRIAA
jgi:hypothetical protein